MKKYEQIQITKEGKVLGRCEVYGDRVLIFIAKKHKKITSQVVRYGTIY